MSISIIVNDAKLQQNKLFGLLMCHHHKPAFLPHDVRATCMVIGQLMSLRVENLLHNKLEEKRAAMKEMVHSIATSHLSTPSEATTSEPKKDLSVLLENPDGDWVTPDMAPYSPPHPLVSLASGKSPELVRF